METSHILSAFSKGSRRERKAIFRTAQSPSMIEKRIRKLPFVERGFYSIVIPSALQLTVRVTSSLQQTVFLRSGFVLNNVEGFSKLLSQISTGEKLEMPPSSGLPCDQLLMRQVYRLSHGFRSYHSL